MIRKSGNRFSEKIMLKRYNMSMAVSASAPRNVAGIATAALAFVALALLLDSPLWLVKLVPTQDGPVHLAQAD